MFPQNPLRCPHKILEFKWIDDKLYYLYCMACGEKIADNDIEDTTTKQDNNKDNKEVTGQVRKLNNKERKLLR